MNLIPPLDFQMFPPPKINLISIFSSWRTLQEYVMQSVKTRRMLQNAKLSFWSHFKPTSELFPELFKFCLNDIHIKSYN